MSEEKPKLGPNQFLLKKQDGTVHVVTRPFPVKQYAPSLGQIVSNFGPGEYTSIGLGALAGGYVGYRFGSPRAHRFNTWIALALGLGGGFSLACFNSGAQLSGYKE